MNANHAVFTQSIRETRMTLERWNRHPARVLRRWGLVSLAISLCLLAAIWAVGAYAQPDGSSLLPDLYGPADLGTVGRIFARNLLVLALHGFICLAGFMAMRAIPQQAELRSGVDRWVHENAGRFAMVFVSAATLFSITTQIYVLGHTVADLAYAYDISSGELLLTVLPHAVLELTAMFLPLAAFLVASRRGDWHELLAATVVTVGVALPVLVVAATVEAYAWPLLLEALVY